MTVEDEILTELQGQTQLMKAQLVVINEIKFELINGRTFSESTFKIKIRTPSLWERFRYWVRGKIKG